MPNGIANILKKYGTSLAETRKLVPELVASIEQERAIRPPIVPTTPQFFSPEDVVGMGLLTETGDPFELEPGWRLKVTPPVNGTESAVSFITPEDWEITQAEEYISPEGQKFNRREFEAFFNPNKLLYENYQRTGGELDIATWGMIGAPLTPGLGPEQVFGEVFQERDVAEVLAYAEADLEVFVKDILDIGRTPQTETLLKAMYQITPAQLDEFFAPLKPWFERLPAEGIDIIMEIAGIRTSVHVESPNLQVWARGILIGRFNVEGEFHPSEKGVREYLAESYIEPPEVSRKQIGKDYNKVLVDIAKEYADIADWTVKGWQDRRAANPERVQEWLDAKASAWEDYQRALRPAWEKTFTAGMGDVAMAASGVVRWMGHDGIADKLSKFAGELQAQAPPDYMGEFEWSMLLNPRFYSTRVLRALPFTLSLVPAAIVGAYSGAGLAPFVPYLGAYGKLILGSVGAALFSRPLESAFEAGTTYDDAIARGMTKEQANEAAMKVFLGNMVLGGWDAVQFAIAFIPIPGAATASRFWKMAMVGGKLTIVGLTEAGEEAYQEVLQRWVVGDEIKLDAEMQQVMSIGGIFGIGLGGAGDVFTRIKGYTRGNLSPEASAKLASDITAFEAEGLTREQAELRAFDELAKTEEGGIATSDAVAQVKQEGFDAETARYREIIEAREAPEEAPVTEPGMPEAGYQPSMVEGVIEKVVRPKGKGRITQISMEEQLKLQQAREAEGRVVPEVPEREAAEMEVGEMEMELAGLKEWLATEPATGLVSLIKKTGWRRGEISNLTLDQYKKITGKETVPPSILTADKKHVQWEYALDSVATELGYRSGEELREAIERAGESLARIRLLEAEIPGAREAIEFPIEVTPEAEVEVRRQLGELSKMHDYWVGKIKTYEETKVSLAKYVRETLPPAVRGKFVTSVARIKTDAQLQTQMARVSEVAELNAQKTLKIAIRKNIKRAQAKIKQHILTGKFTPEVQERLDVITHNLEIARDVAREKMADNIQKYDDGVLSYEEMLKANESLNFAGIDGMSAEELANALEYIKILETMGRSERQAKQAIATERISKIRTDIMNILTGEKGLKVGVGAVPRAQLAAKPGWLDTFVNWQYSLDNLADKLSKLDPTSAPYQSEINKFVAQAHRATNRQAVATSESYNKVKEAIKEVYDVKSTRDINQVLNGLNEEVNLGTFELTEAYKATHPEATTIEIRMTRDEMIAKYMQMQDATLNNTFETGMGWSQRVRDAIDNTLTENEKKLSEKIFDIYEEYYQAINEIYRDLYNVDMPHNPKYSPIRRDLEGNITENVLTFQDAHQFASVINGSLKARIRNIRPLRFNGATQVLSNHIDQMEHFKAWATTMRDFRRVFGHPQVRQAIEQYHGRDIGKRLDTFLSQMARGGIETAATNRVADYLRRAFTKSILAIKPVIGLKQIPSLFAYLSEMKATEFFGGIANFWKSPIANFNFLYKNSEGFRARVSQGFTRDIRAARAKHGINRISGRGSFTDWFLLQIRMGDTMAVTQGMWAKYQVGLKAGLSQADAITAAEDTTNRTQPSFGIDTLSALQNGGSFLKLMTMFQNQPNKYFRIEADALRNFKYGRGSRAKAASTILLVHVILPMMFQYIADAFQWKEERQLRAGLLGSLNYILIGGQLVQTAWGWLTDQPFDYQISPVVSTIDEAQKAFFKAKSMVDKGLDPYKDVTGEDIARLTEYLAKAAGQVLGLPTPFLVQVERGIRTKLQEDEDIDIKDFLFSQWALKPPTKDAGEKVEEAGFKLGEVKEGQEDKPLTEKGLKIYTTVDWFREIGNVYSKVLPQDVLDDKNASEESKAWAEYEIARSNADILPNTSLYKINTEDNADTIIELYQQWKARERIDNLPDLIEFDTLYPKAHLGNVTRQQYSLLVKYLEAEDKDAFLENNPQLRINPRNEWLKANPLDNARLALAGQAKILSIEAYNEFNRLVKELDIPDDAIPEQTLPPEGLTENYFKYLEQGEELGYNSWEVQLLIAQDDELRTFLDRQPIETPVESLELKVKHRDLFEESDAYNDKDSPLYIEDDEARDKARDALKEANPDWVDDTRRIEAIEYEADDSTIESWVERGNLVDEFGGGSSEAKVWLVDNPEVHKWALDNDLLTDDGSDWNEGVLRINVKWRDLDGQYKGIGDKESDFYIDDDDERTEARDKLLENEGYRKDRRRRDAYGDEFPEAQIENYMAYYELPTIGYRQERMLIDNPEFGKAMHDIAGIDLPDPKKIPAVGYDETYEKWQADFERLAGLADHESEYYVEDINQRATARYNMRYDASGTPTEFGKAEKRLDAYSLFVPEDLIPTFVEWYTSPGLKKPDDWKYAYWFEDEWYLMEHPRFYQTMLDLKIWLEPTDFSKVPTREVFNLYKTYAGIPQGSPQLNYRARFPELDAWGILKFGWTPIGQRGKKEVPKTPWEIQQEVERFKELF